MTPLSLILVLTSVVENKTPAITSSLPQGVVASLPHRDGVRALVYSPQSDFLHTATSAHLSQWETKTWKHTRRLPIPKDILTSYASVPYFFFAPNAQGLQTNAFILNDSLHHHGDLKDLTPTIRSVDGKTLLRPAAWTAQLRINALVDYLSATHKPRELDLYRNKAITAISLADVCGMPTLSVNGRLIAWPGKDGTIYLKDNDSGRTQTIGSEVGPALLAFTPDNKYLVASYNSWSDDLSKAHSFLVWDSSNGVKVRLFEIPRSGHITSFAFAPNGKALALGIEKEHAVYLIEFFSGKCRCLLQGHKGTIRALAFAPDGATLTSGSDDKTCLVWDMDNPFGASQQRILSSLWLEELWVCLLSSDACFAFKGMVSLLHARSATVSFFRERIRPVRKVKQQQIIKLIERLNESQLEHREKTFRELEALHDLASKGTEASVGRTRIT